MRAFDLGFRRPAHQRRRADGRRARRRRAFRDEGQGRRRDALAEQLDARNRERRACSSEVTERAVAELELTRAGGDVRRRRRGRRLAQRRHRSRRVEDCGEAAAPGGRHLARRGRHGARLRAQRRRLPHARRLTECADLLEAFGGHAHAAGLGVRRENVAELRRRLNEHASRVQCARRRACRASNTTWSFRPTRSASTCARSLRRLSRSARAGPAGLRHARTLRVVGEPRVLKERHLKFGVWLGGARPRLHLVGRRRARRSNARPGASIELAYSVEANCWNGNTRLQLVVEDLKESDK
jgi:hypothetical protein